MKSFPKPIKKEKMKMCKCSKNIKTPEKNPPPKDECECYGKHGQIMGRCVVCFGQSYIYPMKSLSPIRKTKKKKPITVSYAKGKAWHAFSEYIRRKYADNEGYVQCYTCTTRKPWKNMQAGHGISGRNNGVLFMEQVVKPQCMACNVFARGRYQVFTFKLIKELGMETFEELNNLAGKTVQYKVFQYQDIEDEYKQRLAHMEDNK